ncbi:isopenicillin N synthase family dioxygenase [Naasia lichenicola]|uniref:Isopenicillin N synthase family oxygenase n=1 Tax=Naasia lichenicola TaxID=2565933 RepID=A0A4S4FV68_9MICO|nr:2-oxoglutarate and iron-dependent oxygenase domain-containing protein [Naasia lichenicola]THG33536.1 isopenicillin N synthase family oxygenase [Naasia lichenicola]
MTNTPIPVLDLSLLDQGPEAVERFHDELRRATHEVGFFTLVGHGIPAELQQRLLSTARSFFALPDEDKLEIENLKSPHFRGYARVGGELTKGKVDWREQIDIGPGREPRELGAGDPAYLRLDGPNQWPTALPELQPVIEEWEARLGQIGRRLLAAWAASLGADPAALLDLFADQPSVHIKVVRYPGVPDDAESRQGVGSHKDAGVLTLLWIEPGVGGLQVEHAGEWHDVPPLEDALIVNIGELLEWATDGYLRATVHRVIAPAEGNERISVPFFFNPRLDASVPRLDIDPEYRAEARGVEQDPSNVIRATYGENVLKSRLRAHPDVAAIHHPDLLAPAAAPVAG